MPGQISAIAPLTCVPVACHYVTLASTVPDPQIVALALDAIGEKLGMFGPLRSITKVDLYWPTHPEAPSDFTNGSHRNSLYFPDTKRIAINSEADWLKLLPHEVGHHIRTLVEEQFASVFGGAFGAVETPTPRGVASVIRSLLLMAGY